MNRRLPSRVTVFDVALIAVIMVSGILVVRRLWQGGGQRVAANVYLNGRLVETHPLDRDGVFQLDGSGVTIEVRGGRVRVADSDCPRHTCARMGWVSRAGQTLVCVPNRVLVEVRGQQRGVDAESY